MSNTSLLKAYQLHITNKSSCAFRILVKLLNTEIIKATRKAFKVSEQSCLC